MFFSGEEDGLLAGRILEPDLVVSYCASGGPVSLWVPEFFKHSKNLVYASGSVSFVGRNLLVEEGGGAALLLWLGFAGSGASLSFA